MPPRHAEAAPAPRQHGGLARGLAQLGLSTLLTVVIVVAGGVVVLVVPPASPAAPLAPRPTAAVAPTLAEAPSLAAPPAPTPGLAGGIIESGDDLLSDPIGVQTGPVDPAVDGDLIGWPVSDHTPSTGFGYRSDPFTHRQRWHDGVDLGQPCNDPVHASLDGTVAYVGWAGGYGNRVIIRHADRGGLSFATTYNHLRQAEVSLGQAVVQGQVVGRVGSTGRSTACHLHFEVILDGSYVDPMRFLTGDQSKASLSRRVGSYMPSGLPSPTPSPTASRTAKATPSPSP
ncbi:MAG: M23 family metallopeptidase, partial [Propionibacteriaceae bacterium]|nr:M23 family metallopeptidase [Propionibacteriaceae bacterium]